MYHDELLGRCVNTKEKIFLEVEDIALTKNRVYRIFRPEKVQYLWRFVGGGFCWGTFGSSFYSREEAIKTWREYQSSFNRNWKDGF